MGRWLARLQQDEKNTKTLRDGTDKTDKTSSDPVLSVLSVCNSSENENFSDALDIKASAKRRLADEYDAAQERGEVAGHGGGRGNQHGAKVPDGNVGTPPDAGRFEDRPVNWMPEPGPGVAILRPAVEVSAVEYDRHLDMMIAALPVGTPEAYRLTFAKKKGWCVDRDGERIFTRGRF